jgi:hypothetical protein
MRDALNQTGRPILFSLCEWGVMEPHLWAAEVRRVRSLCVCRLWLGGGAWHDWAWHRRGMLWQEGRSGRRRKRRLQPLCASRLGLGPGSLPAVRAAVSSWLPILVADRGWGAAAAACLPADWQQLAHNRGEAGCRSASGGLLLWQDLAGLPLFRLQPPDAHPLDASPLGAAAAARLALHSRAPSGRWSCPDCSWPGSCPPRPLPPL